MSYDTIRRRACRIQNTKLNISWTEPCIWNRFSIYKWILWNLLKASHALVKIIYMINTYLYVAEKTSCAICCPLTHWTSLHLSCRNAQNGAVLVLQRHPSSHCYFKMCIYSKNRRVQKAAEFKPPFLRRNKLGFASPLVWNMWQRCRHTSHSELEAELLSVKAAPIALCTRLSPINK